MVYILLLQDLILFACDIASLKGFKKGNCLTKIVGGAATFFFSILRPSYTVLWCTCTP